MALRKLLMEVELPKETQQIDRVLQGFADRYHECNPGIFMSPEEAYFISFSIVLLNSDFFNPNNKRKMQKPDYIKNCNGSNASEVNEDVLATLYDNIVYTQFIHIDDEVDLRSLATRGKKKSKIIKNAVQDPVKKAQKEPVDPYTIIFENKLDILRPPIKDVMQFEDPYSYKGTAQCIDLNSLHRTFAKYGVIQIVSARSRPEAFMSPSTIENPDGAQAGVVEMPVTKIATARRENIQRKVEEAEDRLGAAVKQLDGRLRDARHLQVMAPIQPRTREHVMHAAGRMAAKLKWIRIEIVRMKAHRDILIMDLDDEKKAANDAKTRFKEIETIPPKASVVTFGAEWQNLSAEERLKLQPGPTLEEKEEGLGFKPLQEDVQWKNGRLSEEMADSGLASEPEDLSPTTTRDNNTKAEEPESTLSEKSEQTGGNDENDRTSGLHKNAQPQAVEA
ncbi:SEC7-like protein [Neofusicoccum parvum]|uniref:SEC7-like protein n=1 Tax=Neofusicoccum parvum TaxID=310453 RepID=A0ACB5SID8_9PEZI|nr:SEC7-like protein [Neofusicoccum parvum]